MRKILMASAAAWLATMSCVQAAEIKALITTAMDAAVVVLVPQFEKATGNNRLARNPARVGRAASVTIKWTNQSVASGIMKNPK